jgi:hypothetical protein
MFCVREGFNQLTLFLLSKGANAALECSNKSNSKWMALHFAIMAERQGTAVWLHICPVVACRAA